MVQQPTTESIMKKEPIKLTFYSGKLWYSDKPLPVNEPITKASPVGTHAISKVMHSLRIDQWLSSASEVVNPEAIPGVVRGGVNQRLLKWDFKHEASEDFIDGDQITLPDGYGIDKFGVCEGCNRAGMRHCAHADTCGYPKNYIRITLPEKPDNSAHGYTQQDINEECLMIDEIAYDEGHKEGWNAAIDAAIKLFDRPHATSIKVSWLIQSTIKELNNLKK